MVVYLKRQENGNSIEPWKARNVLERNELGNVFDSKLFTSNPYIARSEAYVKIKS